MKSDELEQKRQSLAALSSAQRLQLQADLRRVRESAVETVARPARTMRVPLMVAGGAALALALFRRRRSHSRAARAAPVKKAAVTAAPLFLAALLPWIQRASTLLRFWRTVQPYLAQRQRHHPY